MLREETVKALNDWGADAVKFARIKIGDRNRKRKSKITGKIRKGAIDNTGKLRNSLSYDIKEMPNSFSVAISAEDYIEELNDGEPHGASFSNMMSWIKTKPIKFRDANGKFVKATQKQKEDFASFVEWKMENIGSDLTGNTDFGGKDVGFFDEAVREATEKNEEALTDAAFKDVESAAAAALNNINNG